MIENCLARFVIIRYDKSRKVVTRGLKSLPAEAGGFNQKGDYKNTPSAQNMTIPAADSLNEKYQNKVANVNKQAVVTDATGGNEPIKKVVNNTLNDSDLRYNGTNKNILKKTLNPDQVVALNKLENEKNKGDGSVSQEMVDKMQKAKTDFKSPTGKSASLRLGAKIASESESAIKASVDPNNGIGGLVINQFLNNGDKNKND